jgi:catechol 2,3-dioxygenase-like lactoylglutathione lyase family enzyme
MQGARLGAATGTILIARRGSMIDHASIGVRDLAAAAAFYEQVLATIGLEKLVVRETTVGFGKRYPEFWLNARPAMSRVTECRQPPVPARRHA